MSKIERLAQLRRILAIDPVIEAIVLSDVPLDQKRQGLRSHLSEMLLKMFDGEGQIAPLEWITCRDAVWVLRNILSPRSEELAGFSVLDYIDRLLHRPGELGLPRLTPDFLAEFEHLIKGANGLAGIYKEKPPAFLRHSGRKAARLRSADLSRMARRAATFQQRYACGLDPELVRRRSQSRQNIQQHFGITDLEWNDWRWHTSNIIRNADVLGRLITLSDAERQAVEAARSHRIPFGITPYYCSLMDPDNSGSWDRAIRAQVIPPGQYVEKMTALRSAQDCSLDFMVESDTSPIEGITRRYPNIVILKPILTCPQICVYCQRNWQIEDVYSTEAALGQAKLDRALQWIEETPEITEVLITGGDPLLLSDEKIDEILARLAQIDHVVRIRLGTRTPVTLPQRITESLVRTITRYHEPGRREMMIVTHFEHTTEITPEAMQAVQRFRLFGVSVYNQLVFTYFNSRRFETAALRQKLRLIGVTPYYTFNTKGKEETDNYRVPLARLGKNYLRAGQNRDIISILPDGRRVYEFHPWEKKMALMDTYVYTDISIYQYLRRLKRDGERMDDYETIWYYY